MEQSQKDANIKVAWITGGFALVGTVITLLFTNGIIGPGRGPGPTPTPTPTTILTPEVTPSPPPTTKTPTPPLVPPELVGNWAGGPAGQANVRLRITASADYILWDVNVPNSVGTGKVAVKGAILEFHGSDGSFNRWPWSVEETPRGDELHLGVYHYLRE